MSERASLLVVDDDPVTLDLMGEVLTGEGYGVTLARTGDEALRLCRERAFDLVLTDVRMPGISGVELLRKVKEKSPETIFVVMTAFGSMDTAVQVIREGGYDYLSKPFKMDEVRRVVKRALEQRSIRRQQDLPEHELAETYSLDTMIGRSGPMQDLYKGVARTAQARSNVLIQGESGTGKELVARAIHFHGPRAKAPFVAVNCGAIPEPLMESELFGHVKGAFTGAVTARQGLFEEATGGTLFLDEVGELSMAMQAKLLRALQEHEIKRVGSNEVIHVDARVISATHRELELETREGRFREDLYYRLSVVALFVPPLRDRRDDIPILCEHFLVKCRASGTGPQVEGLSPETLDLLVHYDWPGNVRELENVIERGVALTSNRYLSPEDLPARLREGHGSSAPPASRGGAAGSHEPLLSLREVEKRHILEVLRALGGNKTRAAEVLGISRRTLIRVAQRFGLEQELKEE